MKQNKSFDTWSPLFPGFYNSVFEYYGEESDITSYNEENGTQLEYGDFNWDYKGYMNRVASAFVSRLETELKAFLPDIKLEFQEVVSPKEYNFKTDTINISATFSLFDLIVLIKKQKECAAVYFFNEYTSRSGFVSFHSSNLNDWLNIEYIMEEPEHRIGALLACLCWLEIDADSINYWCDSEMWCDHWPNESVTVG